MALHLEIHRITDTDEDQFKSTGKLSEVCKEALADEDGYGRTGTQMRLNKELLPLSGGIESLVACLDSKICHGGTMNDKYLNYISLRQITKYCPRTLFSGEVSADTVSGFLDGAKI